MIPRITRGSSAAAALGYDFGPGRREEHVDARTVAGNLAGYWQDQAATMDTVIADRAAAGGRGQALVKAVWRTSLRAAPQDRTLTDAEWGQIATRYITVMGLADHPWTATRHGEDHIHLTVSRVSWTGRVASLSHDFAKAQSACRVIEAEHHLIDASTRYNRTKPQVVHGEREYAARRAQVPERERLRTLVGAAAEQVQRAMGPTAGARGITASDLATVRRQVWGIYEARLKAAGVLFRANRASTGRMSGYSYGLAGHTDAGGQQVFFKGSQLGKGYSWAATREHLLAAAQRAMMTKQAQTQDRQAQQECAALPLGERAARLAQARAEQAARGQADAELMQQVPQRLWRRPGVAAGEQRRAATAAQGAATNGRAADQQPGQLAAQDPDHTQQPRQPRRPGQELVSAAERERLRAEHDQIRARQAQQHKAMAAAETGHRQAIAAQQKAQQDLKAVSYRRNEALEQVGNAQRAASQAQGALERVRTEVERRSWLGRARQQFAEDLGTVTGGRAGVPRGQDQARIRALQECAAAAERTLAAAERVLEASNQKVVAALKVAEGADGAAQAAAQVLSQARKVRPESTMALTPYEELLFWEQKAADPEGIRHKQEADAEHAEVMQARRRAQSLGHRPGRGPDRGHGYGR